MATTLVSSRLMVRNAAQMLDNNESTAAAACAMVKIIVLNFQVI